MLTIWLVTHPRETLRLNNTGKIVVKGLSDIQFTQSTEKVWVKRIIWDRVAPCSELLSHISQHPSLLVYPHLKGDVTNGPAETFDSQRVFAEQSAILNVVILDGTWQETSKIYNKSAYLKVLNKLALEPKFSSRYQLRRNQKAFGLCTAEAVIEVLTLKGYLKCAAQIDESFSQFLLDAKC